jgi:hypothetical protein
MSPKHVGKLALLLVCCGIALAPPSGCFPFQTLSVLPNAETWKDAKYPLEVKDGVKKGKEVVLALFVSIAPGMGSEYARSEVTLASDLAKKLPELAKENKQKISVIDPVQINKFAMMTKDFVRMHPSEWGLNLGADYVFTIHVSKMSFYQPGSQNRIYEGMAEVVVDIFDVNAGRAEPKYHYILPFKYPHEGHFDASTIPVNRFKQDFLEKLAVEISGKHIRHKEVTDLVDYK